MNDIKLQELEKEFDKNIKRLYDLYRITTELDITKELSYKSIDNILKHHIKFLPYLENKKVLKEQLNININSLKDILIKNIEDTQAICGDEFAKIDSKEILKQSIELLKRNDNCIESVKYKFLQDVTLNNNISIKKNNIF